MVFLTVDKVRINGRLYAWDEEKKKKKIKYRLKKKKSGRRRKRGYRASLAISHPPPSKITIINIKTRSLYNEVEALQSILLEFEPNLVTITET